MNEKIQNKEMKILPVSPFGQLFYLFNLVLFCLKFGFILFKFGFILFKFGFIVIKIVFI
jgi:hypothetical protein